MVRVRARARARVGLGVGVGVGVGLGVGLGFGLVGLPRERGDGAGDLRLGDETHEAELVR